MGSSSGSKVKVSPTAPSPKVTETAVDVIEARDAQSNRLRLAQGRGSTYLTRGMKLSGGESKKQTLG